MQQIPVETSKHYNVYLGQGLFDTAARQILFDLPATDSILVVSDNRVFDLYGKKLCNQFSDCGRAVCSFVFPAGEQSKSFETLYQLLDTMQSQLLTRHSCVVALGGGVCGDLAGLAASLYMRGCSFVQIPTTLLAMVDSSIGGKTAVNLGAGKNLIGSFYQPDLVLADINLLTSLEESVFNDGCAEIIKAFVLSDASFFHQLATKPLTQDLVATNSDYVEQVIARSITIKRDIVSADEREHGSRMLLNLGHTLGHAIEAASNYSLSHGSCVATGLTYIVKLFAPHLTDDICELLGRHNLPTDAPYTAKQLMHHIKHDKKCHDTHVNLIVPQEIGSCHITEITLDELSAQLDAFL